MYGETVVLIIIEVIGGFILELVLNQRQTHTCLLWQRILLSNNCSSRESTKVSFFECALNIPIATDFTLPCIFSNSEMFAHVVHSVHAFI